MATVKINFNDLRDAAKQSRNAAGEMESYADRIPSSISNPLSSLTGGSSSYTSTAASLAVQKQSQLRNRATAYRNLATQAENFATYAQEVDKNVGRQIEAVADRRAEGLEWWQKVGYAIFKSWNHQFGATEAGAFISNVVNVQSWVHAKRSEWRKRLFDWFAHGDGKYRLNIVLAGIGVITSIAGMVLTFPVGTVLAAIVAIATVVATVVTVVDSYYKIKANFKALSQSSTEPGQARYYGTISDVSDYAKKTSTNAGLQGFADAFDMTGKIAGAVAFIGGLGVTRGDNGVKGTVKNWHDWRNNAVKKFGFKFESTTNNGVTTEKLCFNLKLPFDIAAEHDTKLDQLGKWSGFFNCVESIDHTASPIERMLKIQSSLTDRNYTFDGYGDIKNASKAISSFAPGLSGYDKFLGYGHSFLKLY